MKAAPVESKSKNMSLNTNCKQECSQNGVSGTVVTSQWDSFGQNLDGTHGSRLRPWTFS